MQNYLCCIYIATNTINNKSYIGYTSNFNSRRRTHKSAAIKNTYNSYFHKAIRKYGWENFKWEIIYQSNDIDFTKNIMEGYLISKLETIKHWWGPERLHPMTRKKLKQTAGI